MTLKFFLRIRIDSNQIKSNANSNRIESNPVFLSSNRIELKLERIESNRITLKFDSNRFVRNLKSNTSLRHIKQKFFFFEQCVTYQERKKLIVLVYDVTHGENHNINTD